MASQAISKAFRGVGQALDFFGRRLEVAPYVDKLQPATRIVALHPPSAKTPLIPVLQEAFIASSASIVGNVRIGAKTNVWYGAVVRGDVESITIGSGTTLGDRSMIHCSGEASGKPFPTKIGNNVVVGAGAIVHGAQLNDGCYIGEGAQVMDGVKVGTGAIVTAGSFVPTGKNIPANQLWAGIPAKYEREVMPEETEKIKTLLAENQALGESHALEFAKTWEQIEEEEHVYEQIDGRNEDYYPRLSEDEQARVRGDVEGHMVPGRILNTPVSTRSQPESRPQGGSPSQQEGRAWYHE